MAGLAAKSCIMQSSLPLSTTSSYSSAVTTIYDQKPVAACQGYAQRFRGSIETFLKSYTQNTVEIAWCPGHEGIEDNEKVDESAKEAGKLWATYSDYQEILWDVSDELDMGEILGSEFEKSGSF